MQLRTAPPAWGRSGGFSGFWLAATLVLAAAAPLQPVVLTVDSAVTGATAAGHLRLYPGGTPRPLVSVINYSAGQTRANNAIAPLGEGGSLAIFCGQSAGTVHVIVDVNGYFE